MKKKVMAVALAAATVVSMVGVTGVSAATEVAKNDLAYKGELEIMHYSTSEESEGNGGSDGFRTTLAAWQEAHPDITLNENVLANAEYKNVSTAVTEIINDFVNNKIKISPASFILLHRFIEETTLNNSYEGFLNFCIMHLIDNETCQNIILQNPDFYSRIMRDHLDSASELKKKIHSIVDDKNFSNKEFQSFLNSIL